MAAPLTIAARRRRMAATAAGLGLLLAGTAWGSDDHFPFGPFRMFATATDPDGRVAVAVLVGTTTDGTTFELDADDVGMRRAELEGQLARARSGDETVLTSLVAAYEARRPADEPSLTGLHLVSRGIDLDGGRPADEPDDRVLASWARP